MSVLSDEQVMLKDSVERYVREQYTDEHRLALSARPDGFGRDEWRTFCEMGWVGISYPSEVGGLDGGAIDLMVVMEAVGRGLLLEPFLASGIFSARILEALVGTSVTAREVASLLGGETIISLAYQEPGERYDPSVCTTQLRRKHGRDVINGRKSYVLIADAADRLIVTATRVGDDGSNEPALVRIAATAPGVAIRSFRLLDCRRAAEITLCDVEVGSHDLLATGQRATAALERAVEYATVAVCAEALGVTDRLFEQVLEYMKARRQFGAPLASRQIVQHRLADLFAASAEARSLVWMAARALTESERGQRVRLLSAAKVGVLERAMFVAREAIQLHGGIGMSEELSVGTAFKRMKTLQLLCGDSYYHLARFIACEDGSIVGDGLP